MVNQFKISRTIREADRIIKGFTNSDGSIDEKKKRKAISNLYKSHKEGKYSSVEVAAFLSLLDRGDKSTLHIEDCLVEKRRETKLHKKILSVGKKLSKTVPSKRRTQLCFTREFARIYCQDSISFENFLHLAFYLFVFPTAEYLRMTPKQRRKCGTKVPMHELM